jgi:hypothetical protein
VRRGPNTTLAQREQIIGMLRSSSTVREVADAYNRTNRYIRQIRTKYSQTGSTHNKPRSS